jgi:DNA/RNA-binding domain of Phe-tRNA-synthetase-like protein
MRGVHNPELSPELEACKRAVEAGLRTHAARSPHDRVGSVGRAYADYYRSYGKTYHVLAQWESVAVKGKAIPRRAALVEAMYIAELKNLILTAGHDLASIALPVRADVTHPGDRYSLMNGAEQTLHAGDMMMVDGNGIISSVLYGPDRKTRITPETRDVLFAVYAPAGIGKHAVEEHLNDIQSNVLLVAPEAETELIATSSAD